MLMDEETYTRLIHDLAIDFFESLLAIEDDEPECKYSSMEDWEEWSDERWLYQEILDYLRTDELINPYDTIWYMEDKMNRFALISTHESKYRKLWYHCIELTDWLANEESMYMDENNLNEGVVGAI